MHSMRAARSSCLRQVNNVSSLRVICRTGRQRLSHSTSTVARGRAESDRELEYQDVKDKDSALLWLEQQGNLLGEEAENEAKEEQLAATVGIHLRGDSIFTEGVTRNEDESQRHHLHKMLYLSAEKGDFSQSENIIKQMNENNQLPGPKAYHALIFSYVKGGYARGALNAIRTEVSKGIRPFPQSYAVVLHGFLKEGDIDTAIAIYASNKRSGISFEASWNALCTALFNLGDYERAVDFLSQGEKEDLKPDKRLFGAMINSMCRKGDLQGCMKRLKQMKQAGYYPDKNILSAIVTAHALSGKLKEAESFLLALVNAPGIASAMTIGSINAILQMYLKADLSKEGLAERISILRQVMVRGGMTLDRKGYSLLLEASVQLEDPKVGWLAFQSLQSQPRGSLQYIKDETMSEFLFDLSLHGEPSKIDTVLSAMTTERRDLKNDMMKTDQSGKTFVTLWLDQIKDLDRNRPNSFCIDGVTLDAKTLCALNEEGIPLGPTKMSVRELRAELAARQYPLRGNKRELTKQLQKARTEADVEGASSSASKPSKSKKVDIIIAEESWRVGELEEQNLYEDEREILAEEDEDDSTPIDEESEFLESSPKSRQDDEDEDDNFDYEDRVFSVMKARGKKLDSFEDTNFNHSDPGISEAILLVRRVKSMGADPSKADLRFISHCLSPELNHLAEELLHIADGCGISLDSDVRSHLQQLSGEE